MLVTWDQRTRREGIKVTRLQFPVPSTQKDLYDRFERAITPQTRVLHFCHITNLTGQLFPVRDLCRMARERGITTIVDGAHSVAHFPYQIRDLECDFYGTSLHKWLCAPVGNGFLYVRKDAIAKTWPLQAAGAGANTNIRKFEEIGTIAGGAARGDRRGARVPPGDRRRAQGGAAALSDDALGERAEEQPARSRSTRASSRDRPGAWRSSASTALPRAALAQFLMDKYRIIVVGIQGGAPPAQVFDYNGLRVTPNVYTTLEEIDTFIAGDAGRAGQRRAGRSEGLTSHRELFHARELKIVTCGSSCSTCTCTPR